MYQKVSKVVRYALKGISGKYDQKVIVQNEGKGNGVTVTRVFRIMGKVMNRSER